MRDIHEYRHIIWDWNGTLLADVELTLAASNRQRARYGLPSVTLEQYRELFTFPISRLYERMGFDLTRLDLKSLCGEWLEDYEARVLECQLQPSALQALKATRERGQTQSILSLHGHDQLMRVVAHHGLLDYFATAQGAGSESAYKSKVAAGEAWFRQSGFSPDEVLVIGDTLHDHEVADAIGCDCALVAAGFQSRAILESTGRVVLHDLSGIAVNEGAI